MTPTIEDTINKSVMKLAVGFGAVTTYGYDGLDRVSAITHKRANGSVISAESDAYDTGGNLTYKIVDGVRTDYAYDAVDQLLSESASGTTTAYAYNGNGNRLPRTANGVAESYAYDDCGRTRTVQSPGGSVTTLSYDYEDRLTSIVGPGLSASYAYNGADARVGKTVAGGAGRTYRRDGVGVTAPVLSDGLATMVPGISERSNGTTRFSHLDRLGTNAKTTDSSGSMVDAKAYDAFGLPRAFANPTGSQKGFASAFGYQEDAESGLKLLGHRYYDAATGRFITRDPIGSGTNWYRYADNNPLKCVDPDGLQRVQVKEGDAYYDTIKGRIDTLRANGEKDAADSLDLALKEGRIYVETDPKKMLVNTKVGPTEAAAYVTVKSREMTFDAVLLKRPINLEMVLFHESVHLREATAGLPSQEQVATRVTEAYARHRSSQEKRKRSGDDTLWDSYAYTNTREGAQFVSADEAAMRLYGRLLYQRLFPLFP